MRLESVRLLSTEQLRIRSYCQSINGREANLLLSLSLHQKTVLAGYAGSLALHGKETFIAFHDIEELWS